jgi:hypothetical protein
VCLKSGRSLYHKTKYDPINIGKRLSALGGTLTALAGEPDEIMGEDEDGDQDMFSANVYEVVFILFPFSNVNGIILC